VKGCVKMDKWPDVFTDIISNIKNTSNNFGDVHEDIKVENPQPYLNPNPTIPIPEVKDYE
jgi:hypothetical protein